MNCGSNFNENYVCQEKYFSVAKASDKLCITTITYIHHRIIFSQRKTRFSTFIGTKSVLKKYNQNY